MMLVEAALSCPLVGVTTDDPTTCHRVEMSGLPMATWGTATHAEAVCGAAVKLLERRWVHLRTRGSGLRRCPTCRTWRAES